ncbi:hypothetical protein DPEC_G00338120 [Dallia pectoralis]|uniref:Uncharacterized protein n=1 Tax=Dallia pectoralis TaxID=75939 RepID=A0ACC2F4H6_DALPE|nr:hypothetical protein DPEC_G00338120 [Dallia pectoralis]
MIDGNKLHLRGPWSLWRNVQRKLAVVRPFTQTLVDEEDVMVITQIQTQLMDPHIDCRGDAAFSDARTHQEQEKDMIDAHKLHLPGPWSSRRNVQRKLAVVRPFTQTDEEDVMGITQTSSADTESPPDSEPDSDSDSDVFLALELDWDYFVDFESDVDWGFLLDISTDSSSESSDSSSETSYESSSEFYESSSDLDSEFSEI